MPCRPDRLYVLDLDVAPPVCLAARGKEEAWRWHARMGHVNMNALRKLAREEMVRGLPPIEQVDQLCDACLAGKQRRNSFPAVAQYRAERTLEIVHGDLCGPITPATPSGGRYFLLLVDDKSRFMWLSVMSTKDQAAAAIKAFQERTEAESGLKLGVLRTDRGGEFTSVEFAEYCAAEGVRRQLTAPYSPQQNGVVERRNGTVVATARSMLKAKGLPGWFWGEAVNTAVYILNRCPTKSVTGMTPFEAWYGKKPAVHHLKTFGCIAYVRNTTPHLKKLEDRGRKMIFVGYERGTKAYRAYDPVTRRVHITRDMNFDEEAQWDWSHGEEGGTAAGNVDDTFTVEFTTRYAPGDPEEMLGEEAATPGTPPVATSAWQGGPSASPPGTPPAATSTPSASTSPVHFVTPLPLQGDELDADYDDDVPLRFRAMDDVVGRDHRRAMPFVILAMADCWR